MKITSHLQRQKELAKYALRTLGASVGYGKVRGLDGLQVRVRPGGLRQATDLLMRYGVTAPVEVVEMEMPRAQNPGDFVLKEIHPPPDPSPSTLKGSDREYWESVYESALDYYGATGAPDPKKVASRTAWRAWRASQGLQRTWTQGKYGNAVAADESLDVPDSDNLPIVGDTIELGPILEYVWVDIDTGILEVRRWEENHPTLHWQDDQKTLYVFPGAKNPKDCGPVTKDLEHQAEVFRRWAQREPQCVHEYEVDIVPVHPMGVADSLVYRSDKWHSRNPSGSKEDSQEYFHQHTDGTWVLQDSDEPNVILMRGGLLDVEERGIIH